VDPVTYTMDPLQIEAAITPPHQNHSPGSSLRQPRRYGPHSRNRPPPQPDRH
jgi:hypothetical protein